MVSIPYLVSIDDVQFLVAYLVSIEGVQFLVPYLVSMKHFINMDLMYDTQVLNVSVQPIHLVDSRHATPTHHPMYCLLEQLAV